MLFGWAADVFRSKKAVRLFTKFFSISIMCLLAFDTIVANFWQILTISAASSFFISSGILDAYCLDLLGKKHPDDYG